MYIIQKVPLWIQLLNFGDNLQKFNGTILIKMTFVERKWLVFILKTLIGIKKPKSIELNQNLLLLQKHKYSVNVKIILFWQKTPFYYVLSD